MRVYTARVDGLAQTWQEWARIGGELTEQDWRRPTRCESWQVAHLYAHHSAFPVVLAAPASSVATETAPVTAVEVLRGFNAPGGVAHANAPRVADRAITESAAHPSAELVARFASTAPTTIAALRDADPAQPVPWASYVVTLAEALRIALLEATVHLLDLQRALGRAPTVPEVAVRETALLLAELAPPIEFIESATGRAASAPPLPVIR
jgi:uncharacterized protein (TIGR03083 family)